MQRVYDALSDKNKGLLDDYLDYIQYKDGKEQARDRAQDQRRYEELVQQLSLIHIWISRTQGARLVSSQR